MEPKPPFINRQDIPTIIAGHLRRQIFDGDLKPGAPLRQMDLAAQYGTSRIPLREALRQLEAEGLVLYEPNKGAIVAPISISEIQELLEARMLLEPYVLGQAIPHHTEDTWKQADKLNKQMTAEKKQTAWGEMNSEFHRVLYAPASKPRLLSMIETLRLLSERFSSIVKDYEYTKAAHGQHAEILEACRNREISLAQEALRSHIEEAGEELIGWLRKAHQVT